MIIEKTNRYLIDYPVAFFIPADFKSRSSFYKRLDIKYDIRRKFKDNYRYYSDIYSFNNRKGDCLKITKGNVIGYGIIVSSSVNDIIEEGSVINAIDRFRYYILRDNHKEVQFCLDGVSNYISEARIEEILEDAFEKTDIVIKIFKGGGI